MGEPVPPQRTPHRDSRVWTQAAARREELVFVEEDQHFMTRGAGPDSGPAAQDLQTGCEVPDHSPRGSSGGLEVISAAGTSSSAPAG